MTTAQDAAASQNNIDRLEESKQRSRAAELERLQARDEARRQAIEAQRQRIAELRAQQEAVPKTGQVQQGFRQEKGGYAGFVTNHKPVYVINNVPNFVPEYTESEKQQINTIFGQIVEAQRKLDQLLGTNTAETLQEPQYLTPDTRTGPNSTSIDYAGTLAARELGYNVGSGLVTGLEPTFEKEQQKQFAEHNKFIGLTENITTEKAKQINQTVTEPPKITPQNPRPHILTGQPPSTYANPEFAQKGSANYQGIKKESHPLGVDSTHTILGLTENITNRSGQATPLTKQQVKENNLANIANVKDFVKKAQENKVPFITLEVNGIKQQVPTEQAYRYYTQAAKGGKEVRLSTGAFTTISLTENLNIGEDKMGLLGYSQDIKGKTSLFVGPQKELTKQYDVNDLIPLSVEGNTLTGISRKQQELVKFDFTPQITKTEPKTIDTNIEEFLQSQRLPENKKGILDFPPIIPGKPNYEPFISTGKAINLEAVGGFAGLVNIERTVGNIITEKITSNEFSKQPLIETGKLTASGEGIGELFGGVVKYAQTGNKAEIVKGAEQAGKTFSETASKQGIFPTIAGVGFTLLTAGGASGKAGRLEGLIGKIESRLKSRTKPKVTTLTEAISTGGKKAYPTDLLRDQGYGERPILERGTIPKEEINIRKAFNIPEPAVQDVGVVRGARDYGNLRKQIESITKQAESTKPKIVQEDVFYQNKLTEITTRAKEKGTYRIQTDKLLGTVENPKGENPLKDIFAGMAEPTVQDVGSVKGASGLGNLSKYIASLPPKTEPFGAPTSLKGKPIEYDTTYSPSKNLPKTRAKKVKTYRVQSEQILGTIEKPKGVNILGDIFRGMKEPVVKESTAKPSIKDITKRIETEKEYPKLFEPSVAERTAKHADIENKLAYSENESPIPEPPKKPKGYTGQPPYDNTPIDIKDPFAMHKRNIEAGEKLFGVHSNISDFFSGLSGRRTRPKPPPKGSEGGSIIRTSGGQMLIMKEPQQIAKVVTKLEQPKAEQLLKIKPLEKKKPLLKPQEEKQERQLLPYAELATSLLSKIKETQAEKLTRQYFEGQKLEAKRRQRLSLTPRAGLEYGLEYRSALRTGAILQTKPTLAEKEIYITKPRVAAIIKPIELFKFKQAQKEQFKFAQPQAFATPQTFKQTPQSKLIQPLQTKTEEQLKTKTKTKPPPPVFGFKASEKSKKERERELKPNNFLGQNSEIQIQGLFRRGIVYGVKRTARQERKETTFIQREKGFTKFVTKRQGDVTKNTRRGDMFTRTTKKKSLF